MTKNRLAIKEVNLQTWNSTWRGTEGGGCSLSSASPLTKCRGCVLCTPSTDDQSIKNENLRAPRQNTRSLIPAILKSYCRDIFCEDRGSGTILLMAPFGGDCVICRCMDAERGVALYEIEDLYSLIRRGGGRVS
jgi:hypothetical protein